MLKRAQDDRRRGIGMSMTSRSSGRDAIMPRRIAPQRPGLLFAQRAQTGGTLEGR